MGIKTRSHIIPHPQFGDHHKVLPSILPRLLAAGYEATSNYARYNCIAWAAGVKHDWWWPVGVDSYWPDDAPRELTVAAFEAVFAKKGYQRAQNFDLEAGFEKVALYVDANDVPLHMARQLGDGSWTSKCGPLWDITHYSLNDVCGGQGQNDYGTAKYAYRRPKDLEANPGGPVDAGRKRKHKKKKK